MIHYFRIFNKHKNLSLRRKSDDKQNRIITAGVMIVALFLFTSLFVQFLKEDVEAFSMFVLPAIVLVDFSIRFFFKKNTSAAIVPYLTLPIPRKTLIFYMILSDLQSFWIWDCWLIAGIILYSCGVLTFWTAITALFFILLNNYLIYFVKALMDGYAILTYPFCLGFVLLLLLIFNPLFVISILSLIVLSLIAALFFVLQENLYKELNRIAL